MKYDWINTPAGQQRVHKKYCRSLVVSSPPKPARSVLMLPGNTALCVQEAIRVGLINRQTKCLFVERCPITYQQMVRKLRQVGQGRLSNLYVNSCKETDLHLVDANRSYDFCFLDFLGPLTRGVSYWMATYLRDRLIKGATVAVTLNGTYRNCAFSNASEEFFIDKGMRSLTHHFRLNGGDVVQSTYLHTLLTVLYPRRFSIDFIRYNDSGRKMFTFILRDVPVTKENYVLPYADEYLRFVSAFQENRTMAKRKATKTTEEVVGKQTAGQKAWATRKAKEVSERQRQAAFKAWDTRRANARKAARTASRSASRSSGR